MLAKRSDACGMVAARRLLDPHARTCRESGRFHCYRPDLAAVEAEIVQRAIVELAQRSADGPRFPTLPVAGIRAASERYGGAERLGGTIADEHRALHTRGLLHLVRRDRSDVRVTEAARRRCLAPPPLELVPLVRVVAARRIVAGGARRQERGRRSGGSQRNGIALGVGGNRLQFSVR